MTEQTIIEPIREDQGSLWEPTVGDEAFAFLQHSVPPNARDSVRDASVSILGKGISPDSEGTETGLVVGYVQSGKTMSFESVAALAHDNGFQIVILIAGSSIPLFDQSAGRMRQDLQLEDVTRARRWIPFRNPRATDATIQPIRDVLDEWRNPGIPHVAKRSVLITTLKHHTHLQHLTNLLRRLDLRDASVLIIDDEADQASLNTDAAQGTESRTYQRLMEVRDAAPNHTYLQYTATPQAPLLINIIDSLSPNFVQVLQAGDDYVGGRAFFGNGREFVRVIPPSDVPTNANILTEPPESLIDALRIFMVGVTVGILESGNTGNRSMFVSPSHRTGQHQSFYGWVRDVVNEWKRRLTLHDNDPDKQELIEDLRVAYAELGRTVAGLPPFEELVPNLSYAFGNTRVLEVNARGGRTPQVNWRDAYGWILVGGQAMDRGFTVEGLTVTYMPRGVGVGHADTIQQRGRFFGYKREYLGYCRVFLEQGTLDAFRAYVAHEEFMRAQLEDFQKSGRPLNDWKRVFVLDTNLRPCRDSVVQFDYIQGAFSNTWVAPRVVLSTEDVTESNRQIVSNFIEQLQWRDDPGSDARTDAQRHLISTDVPLRRVLADLLVGMRITGTADTQRNLGLLLQLARALENDENEVCTVYRMSPGYNRERGVDDAGEVTNLYAGEFPVFPIDKRGTIYPGDRALHDEANVTLQIRDLDLTRGGNTVANRVPVISVWVPGRLATPWLAQEPQN